MTTPLPVSLVYGSKTRPDDPSPLRFLLLDVTEEGMAIVAPLSNTCIDTAFSSLEQAEGWLLRDPRWKHCREDAAVLERFWIKHDGAWQSLRHALEVEGLRLRRTEVGMDLARRAKAPARASDTPLASQPPWFPLEEGDRPLIKETARRRPPPTASLATAAGKLDDPVAKGARCARQLLGAYHLDRHHHPLASALHSPVAPKDVFLEGHLRQSGVYHIDGTEDEAELAAAAERGWRGCGPAERHLEKARYWAGRVREAPDANRLLHDLERWHDEVLLLGGEAALPEGDVPLPQAPSASSLSPVAKPWARQAFREMASWLAKEPWEEGLAEGSDFDDALTDYGRRWLQARADRQWRPRRSRKRQAPGGA